MFSQNPHFCWWISSIGFPTQCSLTSCGGIWTGTSFMNGRIPIDFSTVYHQRTLGLGSPLTITSLFNIAMDHLFFEGKIIYRWAIVSMAMLKNQGGYVDCSCRSPDLQNCLSRFSTKTRLPWTCSSNMGSGPSFGKESGMMWLWPVRVTVTIIKYQVCM